MYVLVAEANYVRVHKDKMDYLIEKQKNDLNAAAKLGHGGHEGAAHEEGTVHEGAATETHEGAATESHEAEKAHEGAEEHH